MARDCTYTNCAKNNEQTGLSLKSKSFKQKLTVSARWKAVGKQEWTVITRNLYLMLPHLMLMVPECLSSALIKPPLLINLCSLTRVDRNSIMLLSQPSGGSHRGRGDAAPLTGFTASECSCQDTRQERKPPPEECRSHYKDGISKGSPEKVIRLASINTALV